VRKRSRKSLTFKSIKKPENNSCVYLPRGRKQRKTSEEKKKQREKFEGALGGSTPFSNIGIEAFLRFCST